MATIDTLVGTEDPTKLFELLEELAVGSYGTVYKACVFFFLPVFAVAAVVVGEAPFRVLWPFVWLRAWVVFMLCIFPLRWRRRPPSGLVLAARWCRWRRCFAPTTLQSFAARWPVTVAVGVVGWFRDVCVLFGSAAKRSGAACRRR
jgi:hypothetical protein